MSPPAAPSTQILPSVSSSPFSPRNGGIKRPPSDMDRLPSPDHCRPSSVPGMLGQSDSGGFYAGPTSALSHLLAVSSSATQEWTRILISHRSLGTTNVQAVLASTKTIYRLRFVTPCRRTPRHIRATTRTCFRCCPRYIQLTDSSTTISSTATGYTAM